MTTTPPDKDKALNQIKQQLMVTRIIHLALVMGVVVFGVIVFGLTFKKMTFDLQFGNVLFLVAAVMAAGGLGAAVVLPKVYFKAGGLPADPAAAGGKYQTFVLIRSALIEGPALFSAVSTLAAPNILPAGLLVLCAGVLAFLRPSEREFMELMRRGGLGQNNNLSGGNC